MLLDADRMIEERPALWDIFDGHKLPAEQKGTYNNDSQEMLLLPYRRKAFIYYHLNMYEAVHAFYEPLSQRANEFSTGLVMGDLVREDRRYYDAWKGHIKYFLSGAEVTDVIQSAINYGELSPDYVKFLVHLSGNRLRAVDSDSPPR
jgi:hypothetical protein